MEGSRARGEDAQWWGTGQSVGGGALTTVDEADASHRAARLCAPPTLSACPGAQWLGRGGACAVGERRGHVLYERVDLPQARALRERRIAGVATCIKAGPLAVLGSQGWEGGSYAPQR